MKYKIISKSIIQNMSGTKITDFVITTKLGKLDIKFDYYLQEPEHFQKYSNVLESLISKHMLLRK